MAPNIKDYTKNIQGKEYVMVNGRVLIAHDDNPDYLHITTEVIKWADGVVAIKATVHTRKGIYTGHAASNEKSGSNFEKKTPLEVAETSAIGRALGFAGYAIENGIASADEIYKAQAAEPQEERAAKPRATQSTTPKRKAAPEPEPEQGEALPTAYICADCQKPIEALAVTGGLMPAAQVAERTTKRFGKALCSDCATKQGK